MQQNILQFELFGKNTLHNNLYKIANIIIVILEKYGKIHQEVVVQKC